MQFSLDNLYNLEKDLSSVFGSVFGSDEGDLSKAAIMRKNKDVLANLVLCVAGVLDKSKNVLRSAAVNIEELKSDQIHNQKRLIKLQDELILSKGEQVEAVQTTVKSEIKSFSDAVQQGCKDKGTTKKLEAVVKSAVSRYDR